MDNSIDVMTVKEFVRGFMGKTIEHQANTKLRKLLSVTYNTILYDITGKVDKRKKEKGIMTGFWLSPATYLDSSWAFLHRNGMHKY